MACGTRRFNADSQGLSNNPCPGPNQFLVLKLISHLRLGFPKGLFHVGSPVKILKGLLTSSIQAPYPAHFNLLDRGGGQAPW